MTELRINFKISIDLKEGRINGVYRSCNIPRPHCKGCKFKKWCDKLEKKLQNTKIEDVKWANTGIR